MSCPDDIASKAYVDQAIANALSSLRNDYATKPELNVVKAELTGEINALDIALATGLAGLAATIAGLSSQIAGILATVGAMITAAIAPILVTLAGITASVAAIWAAIAGLDALIQTVSSFVNGVLARLSALESLTDALMGKIANHEGRISTNTTNIDIANNNINSLSARVNELFSELMSTLSNFYSELSERITSVDINLTEMIGRITNTLMGKINGVDAKVNSLNGEITEVNTKVINLTGRVTGIEGNIEGLNNRINNLDIKLDQLGLYLGGLLEQIYMDFITSINQLRVDIGFDIQALWTAIRAIQIPQVDLSEVYNYINNSINNVINKITNLTNIVNNNYTYLDNKINSLEGDQVDTQNLINNINGNTNAKISELINAGSGARNIEDISVTLQDLINRNYQDILQVTAFVGAMGFMNSATKATAIAKEGACQALNNGCGQPQFGNTLNNALTPLNTLLTTADLVNSGIKLDEINGKLGAQIPNGGIGGKLSKLYNNLGIDRILNGLNTALLLHNAMMLSNNLGQSLLYVVDNILQFSGFHWEDDQGNQVTASQVLGGTITNFIKGAIGEDAYINTRVLINKANRIYQSAANVAYSVISIVDIVKNLSELIVENTGKIGNALRKSGVVLEDSYGVLPERNTAKTAIQNKVQSLSDNLQDISEGVETFTEISENLVEGQENLRELRESSTFFENSLNSQSAEAEAIRQQITQQSKSSVDINSVDFIKNTGGN